MIAGTPIVVVLVGFRVGLFVHERVPKAVSHADQTEKKDRTVEKERRKKDAWTAEELELELE